MQSTAHQVFVWFRFLQQQWHYSPGKASQEKLTAFRQRASSPGMHLSHLLVNLLKSSK